MEIKVQAKSLSAILKTASKVVNSKNSLPILGDVLFETKNDVLVVTVSDGEQWLSQKCEVISCDQELRFCVGATEFTNAINNLGDMPITITLDEQTKTFTCEYGNGNGKFSMPYEDANEFPLSNIDTTDTKDFIVDSKKVLRAVELTGFATANDELRPVMNGIHFDFFEDGMVCATSDGHKLARYKDKTITSNNENGTTPNFTLPKKPANILINILSTLEGDIKISFNNKAISFNNKDFKLTARLLEARYPNYDAVIPKDNPITITVDKNTLLNALKRVLPMANDSSNLVELDFTYGYVTVSAKDIDFSKSACETVKCDCERELNIGFKGSTLAEILKNINDDSIVIELSDPSRAGVFYSAFELTREEYLSLCMPMLIQ
jgi:DNA polymerase-3 subunit beta